LLALEMKLRVQAVLFRMMLKDGKSGEGTGGVREHEWLRAGLLVNGIRIAPLFSSVANFRPSSHTTASLTGW